MHSPYSERITNALTVDVADYFQVSALAPHIPRADWDRIPCRVERNVDLILDLFARANAKATFFTLGWIAQRHPVLIRRIVDAGHELASHGYGHERVTDLNPTQFQSDILRAKEILEGISGTPVKGYRAPSFSIGRDNLWAFGTLAESGYKYSSSIYPVRHDHYGMPESPRIPYRLHEGITEIPVATVRVLNNNLPAGGGGYFRFLPYSLSRWAVGRVNRIDRRPSIFYFHPWELDPEQPRVPGVSAKTKFRHYVNLNKTENRLRRLLRDFSWGRMDTVFKESIS